MEIKHKKEWSELVEIARKNGLDNDQTIILLAYRELYSYADGYQFRRLNVTEKTLEAQATSMAQEIKYKESFYQAYLKRSAPNEYIKDFIEYMAENEAYRLKRYVDLITHTFAFSEAT